MTLADRHAAAIRRNLAIPGGEAAARQIFAEFVFVHGGNPRDLLHVLNASSATCGTCGAPRSVTKVLDPVTGKVVRKIVNPCRRCT
jgi:hypothetical protein